MAESARSPTGICDAPVARVGPWRESHHSNEREGRQCARSYGTFTRTVRLPIAVDGSKVTATFKNGLLTVTMPKTAAAKGTTIPIKAEWGRRVGGDAPGRSGDVSTSPSSAIGASPARFG